MIEYTLKSGYGFLIKPVLNHVRHDAGYRELERQRFLPPLPTLGFLQSMPPGSLGHEYAMHLTSNNIRMDFYPNWPVTGAEEYVGMRLNQVHDMWHVLTGFDVSVPEEIGLQAFTYAQSRSTVSLTLLVLGPLHILIYKPLMLVQTCRLMRTGWRMGRRARILLGIPLEDYWAMSVAEVRRLAAIEPLYAAK